MIRGEQVVVWRPANSGLDAYGAPARGSGGGFGSDPFGFAPFGETLADEWSVEAVDDVLVAPAGVADVTGSIRPDGVRVKWQLHFPKTFVKDLRGCEVSVRGQARRPVVGDPQPYTVENTPGRWNYPVELEDIDG